MTTFSDLSDPDRIGSTTLDEIMAFPPERRVAMGLGIAAGSIGFLLSIKNPELDGKAIVEAIRAYERDGGRL